jgi:hypothetical protein
MRGPMQTDGPMDVRKKRHQKFFKRWTDADRWTDGHEKKEDTRIFSKYGPMRTDGRKKKKTPEIFQKIDRCGPMDMRKKKTPEFFQKIDRCGPMDRWT